MNRLANGALAAVPAAVSLSLTGEVAKVTLTLLGSSRTVRRTGIPRESVSVSVSNRCDGYSWSGVRKLPAAWSGNCPSGCVWHTSGQCLMLSDQSNADAPSTPSCASVAFAENETSWPTRHRRVDDGEIAVRVGGSLPG